MFLVEDEKLEEMKLVATLVWWVVRERSFRSEGNGDTASVLIRSEGTPVTFSGAWAGQREYGMTHMREASCLPAQVLGYNPGDASTWSR